MRPPRAIINTPPVYPTLARETRVQGKVIIRAIIDSQGNVLNMEVVSGHPLLIQAALNAVSKWKYEPTYLNEEPIDVEMDVTVTFQLTGP